MNSKKAAAHEAQQAKIEAYVKILKGMIGQANAYPLSYDYSGELEKLYKKHPADRGVIFAAEKEAYKKPHLIGAESQPEIISTPQEVVLEK